MKPILFNALTADSLPGPGPFTKTIKFLRPYSFPKFPAFSAATCAAKGVLFLEPLKPEPPAVAQHNVLPCLSVIVTIVLLKVELITAMPSVTTFFNFLFCFSICFCHKVMPIYFLIAFLGPFLVRELF